MTLINMNFRIKSRGSQHGQNIIILLIDLMLRIDFLVMLGDRATGTEIVAVDFRVVPEGGGGALAYWN